MALIPLTWAELESPLLGVAEWRTGLALTEGVAEACQERAGAMRSPDPFSAAEREALFRAAVRQLQAEKYVWALSQYDRSFLRFLRIAGW